jgi:hypothetical protein
MVMISFAKFIKKRFYFFYLSLYNSSTILTWLVSGTAWLAGSKTALLERPSAGTLRNFYGV